MTVIRVDPDAVAMLAETTTRYLTDLAGRRMDFGKAAEKFTAGEAPRNEVVRQREDLQWVVGDVRSLQPTLFDIAGGFGQAGSRIADAFKANVIVSANQLHKLLDEDPKRRLHNKTEEYVGEVYRTAGVMEAHLVSVLAATQQQADRIMQVDHQIAGGFGW